MPDADAAVLREGAARLFRYLAEALGSPPERAMTVRVFNGNVTPRPAGITSTSCCGLVGDTVIFDTNTPGWPPSTLAADLTRQQRLTGAAVHELAHAWQLELGCITLAQPARRAPVWFIEGMAELLAYRVLAGDGFLAGDEIGRTQLELARDARQYVTLAQLEAEPPRIPVRIQALSATAVERLLARSGEAALVTYCTSVATSDWEPALERVFGISKAAHYRAVDLFLGVDPLGALRTPDPGECPSASALEAQQPGGPGQLGTRPPAATPFTTPANAFVRFARRFPPGTLSREAPQDKYLYAFCIEGFDPLGLFQQLTAQERDEFVRTRANTPQCVLCPPTGGWGADRRYNFVLIVEPSLPEGLYELRLHFPDGRELSTTFTHLR